MNNFKISTRLLVLIGLLSTILIGIGLLGLLGISQANAGLKTVYEDRTVPAGQIADINRLLLRNRLEVANSLIERTPQAVAEHTREIEENIARINKVWDAYTATTLTEEEAKLANKFAQDRARFVQEGLRPAIEALRAGDYEVANRLRSEKIAPLFAPVRAGVDALMQLQLDVAKTEYGAAVSRYETIRVMSIGVMVAGVLVAVLFGVALIRGISRALSQAIDLTRFCRDSS